MAKITEDKGLLDDGHYPEKVSGTAETEAASRTKKSGRGLLGLPGFILIGVFMAVAATGYYLYQQEFRLVKDNVDKILQQQSGEKLQKVQISLDDHADAIAGIKQQQGTHNNLLQQNVVKLDSLDQSLISMSDVSFLLQAANDRLRLLGDVRTARKILTVVATRLENNPAITDEFSEAVNSDLKRLALYEPLDVNQSLFSLNALVDSLQAPPDVGRAMEEGEVVAETSDNVPGDSGEMKQTAGVMDKFIHALSGQIKIVKYDQKLNASNTLTINQHKLDILKLRIAAIRLILLQKDLQVFRGELQLTSHWVNANLDSGQAKKLQFELDKLGKLEFPEIPALKSVMFASMVKLNPLTDNGVSVDLPEAESFQQIDPQLNSRNPDNNSRRPEE